MNPPNQVKAVDEVLELLVRMNSRPEYHFPFVAAQNQFRERYAGMTSAAMLEDLFFDSMNNYVRTNEPGVQLDRPPRGEKGYDYEIYGARISHKVSMAGSTQIAALWDATKNIDIWNFDTPISLTCGNYSKSGLKVLGQEDGKISKTTTLTPVGKRSVIKRDEALVVSRFGKTNLIEVLHIWHPINEGDLADSIPFDEMWSLLAPQVTSFFPANEVELFLVPFSKIRNLAPGDILLASDDDVFRPGTYLLRKDKLQNVKLEKNNRALLVPKKTVAAIMKDSANAGDFVPMGNWYSAYASSAPPDLYLAQRTEFDHMFQHSMNRRGRK